MKTKFIKFLTEDQLLLQGLLYEPEQRTTKVVLHIHGMAGNFYENRFLEFMAQTFTAHGWSFLVYNTRGHDLIADFPVVGEKEEYKRIGNFREKFEDCVLDLKAGLDFLETQNYKTIVLQGHSLGAAKVVYYLAQTGDQRVSKLVLASPPDMVGLAEAESDHQELLNLSKKMVVEGKGDEILPKQLWNWYYLSAKTYLDFGARDNPIDVFNTYDQNKPSVLANIKVPILALFGSEDDAVIVPITKALAIIKNKAINCPQFDTAIIQGAPHSYVAHEQEVVDVVINWLNENE